MQLIPRDAGDEITLVPDGAEVALGPIKDREVAAVTVAAFNIVVVKGTHGSACALINMSALIYAVDILIPETWCQLRVWDLKGGPYAIRHIVDKA